MATDGRMRQTVRRMLLKEMVGNVAGDWKVLVMDELTTKVMSSACKMSDILDRGVALVEDLAKKRQPQPAMAGIYFISPTIKSVTLLCEDFAKEPLYASANVFFSSKVPSEYITEIKKHPKLVARLASLKEVGCEFLTLDSRTFTTDQPSALADLFADGSAGTPAYEACINTAAVRLASVFTALDEFPCIRYRTGKPPGDGDPPGAEARSLVAQRVAAKLHSLLSDLQREQQLPQTETCDLVVVDRSIDPVAPVIHEWTYEAMTYDLLPLNGDRYQYEAENRKGVKESKESLLEESDPMWVDLRHMFIADVSIKLNNLLTTFREQNKAAKVAGGGIVDNSKLKGVVASLSDYNQELSKLSLHIDMASNLNALTRERALDLVGKLEQDLVFGGATSKEVIELLSNKQELAPLDKVRILMCYVATHPEKLDSSKFKQWQKLANLKAEHMHTLSNMEYLGVSVSKRNKSSALSFGNKNKRKIRKARAGQEDKQEEWELSRFQPLLAEVEEDLAKNALPESEYPYVSKPTTGRSGSGSSTATSARSKHSSVGWARRAAAQSSSGGEVDVSGISLQGKRLVVFVLGGVTRNEMRSSYTMSRLLGRDVLLGSTSVESPKSFMSKLYELNALDMGA